MQIVTIVNRTSRQLRGRWDGKQYKVQPGESSHPVIIAEAIKRQNPIMGSDSVETGQLQYLIGIKEQGDPCSPVEQSDEIELFNRRSQKNAVPIMIVPGNVGMYAVRSNAVSTPQPTDLAFVKP